MHEHMHQIETSTECNYSLTKQLPSSISDPFSACVKDTIKPSSCLADIERPFSPPSYFVLRYPSNSKPKPTILIRPITVVLRVEEALGAAEAAAGVGTIVPSLGERVSIDS